MSPVVQAIANQLRDLADGDDQLGRGEFRLLEVSPPDEDSFIITVESPFGGPRVFKVLVSELE